MVDILKTFELNCKQFKIVNEQLFIYEEVYFDRTVKYLKQDYFGRNCINLVRVFDFENDDIKLTFTGLEVLAVFEDYYVIFETEFLDNESRVSLYKNDKYLLTYDFLFSSLGNIEEGHILAFTTFEADERCLCSYDFINQKIKWKIETSTMRVFYSNSFIFAAGRDNASSFQTSDTIHQLSFREQGLNAPLMCFSAIDGKQLWSLSKADFSFYNSLHKTKMKFDDKNNILVIKSTNENFIGIDVNSVKIAWEINLELKQHLSTEFILDNQQNSIYILSYKENNLLLTIIDITNGTIACNENYTLIPSDNRLDALKILGIYNDNLFFSIINEIYKINRISKKVELYYQVQGSEISDFVLFKNKILIYSANMNNMMRHQNGKIDIIELHPLA